MRIKAKIFGQKIIHAYDQTILKLLSKACKKSGYHSDHFYLGKSTKNILNKPNNKLHEIVRISAIKAFMFGIVKYRLNS